MIASALAPLPSFAPIPRQGRAVPAGEGASGAVCAAYPAEKQVVPYSNRGLGHSGKTVLDSSKVILFQFKTGSFQSKAILLPSKVASLQCEPALL